MTSITKRLPTETLHLIVSSLDAPSDILSLALSCKALAEIAIPRHLNYRVFHIKISRSVDIFKFFTQAELTAAEVRELNIIPENIWDVCRGNFMPDRWMANPLVPPKEFAVGRQIQVPAERTSTEQTREYEGLLIEALKRMKTLKRFGWYRFPQPLVRDGDDLWSILGSLGSLELLGVVDFPTSMLTAVDYQAVKELSATETFLNLRGLKILRIHTTCFDREKNAVDPTSLFGMPIENSDLEEIHLHLQEFNNEIVSLIPLISVAHWNHLRVLDITGYVHCTPFPFLAFLQSYPAIEELVLAPLIIGKRWFQKPKYRPSEPLLPKLRRLQCTSYQAVWLVEQGARASITEIAGFDLFKDVVMRFVFFNDPDEVDEADEGDVVLDVSGQSVPSPFLGPFLSILKSNRLPCLTKLGGVECTAATFSALARAFPRVRELSLEPWVWHSADRDIDGFLPHLALLPQLIVLGAIRMLHCDGDHYDLESNVETVRKIAETCLSLERIVFEMTQIVLIREGGRIRWVFRKIGDNDPVVQKGEKVHSGT
ncbi:hypothetical protein GYMLUDRAFT_61599 [Collybiopsis luxurians FD-317 M1]|uniref:F-box domain-containing protein n=1 Tax=Collybiopsis luxurians FD-317 M1 TaxID=944289 RepID=A0A0D0B1N7_9AGAR|nr:hypothetical protein GYMLUDRAFT_61599 [Collybiopsis luxurians FD-317 M1]